MANQEKQANGKLPTIIRANNEDITSAFGLIAGLQEIKIAINSRFAQRFKAVPNGWRNAKMIYSVMNNLLDDVLLTFPPEKLVSMQRMMPHMKFKLYCGASASKMEDDKLVLLEKDLDVLMEYAHEQCKLCFDQDCKRCRLGKVLDGVCAYDRDESSWANIDIVAVMNHGE